MISKQDIEKFNDAKAHLTRAKNDIDHMDRALILMEAGLESRPLDRDFFELMRHKHQENKRRHEGDTKLFEMLDEVLLKVNKNE